jgi:hypothetical protein
MDESVNLFLHNSLPCLLKRNPINTSSVLFILFLLEQITNSLFSNT